MGLSGVDCLKGYADFDNSFAVRDERRQNGEAFNTSYVFVRPESTFKQAKTYAYLQANENSFDVHCRAGGQSQRYNYIGTIPKQKMDRMIDERARSLYAQGYQVAGNALNSLKNGTNPVGAQPGQQRQASNRTVRSTPAVRRNNTPVTPAPVASDNRLSPMAQYQRDLENSIMSEAQPGGPGRVEAARITINLLRQSPNLMRELYHVRQRETGAEPPDQAADNRAQMMLQRFGMNRDQAIAQHNQLSMMGLQSTIMNQNMFSNQFMMMNTQNMMMNSYLYNPWAGGNWGGNGCF